MKRQELQAEFDRLGWLIEVIKDAAGKESDELVALSSQQICVSICGSLEQGLKSIFIEYAKRRSGTQIYRPVQKVCESYQNPKSTKILELVGLFDRDFEEILGQQWANELSIEKQHIDNLVDDRITIAHRKRVHLDISSTKISNYYSAYKSLMWRVYDHFLTDT